MASSPSAPTAGARPAAAADAFLDWVLSAPPLPRPAAALRETAQAQCAVWGLWGPARALALAALARDTGRLLCVVTATQHEAERAADALVTLLGEAAVGVLPARQYLVPGDALPPDEVTAERLAVLKELLTAAPALRAVVLPVHAAMQTLAARDWVHERVTVLERGAEIPPDELARRLVASGFERVTQVERPGEFSMRGGIVDIFPHCTGGVPVRIEFFGDEIDSIRRFDVTTQMSFQQTQALAVMPRLRALELPAEAGAPAGTAFDYLPEDVLVGWWEPQAIEGEHDRLTGGDMLNVEQGAWRDLDAVVAAVADLPSVAVSQMGPHPRTIPVGDHWSAHSAGLGRYARDLDAFWPAVQTWLRMGRSVALFASSDGEADRLEELCREHGLEPARTEHAAPDSPLQVTLGRLHAGVDWPDAGWVLVSEHELYGRQIRRRARQRYHTGSPIEHYTELRVGDHVVHAEHGIGIYRGIEYVADAQADFLIIEYQGGDKLYVPVDQIDLVERYVGGGEVPTVHRLGGAVWKKTKARVQRAIRELAGQLVELYAARQAQPGHAFAADTDWQREFEASFPYELTPDQEEAIAAMKADMESPHPMDRLLCGDVGYGKTEVALRAAFKAVMGGKQAAVLVPTTVLAQQHFQTFTERMAEYPIRVAMLSRLRTAGQNQATLERVAAGQVDVVIGTHRLVQKDVSFRELGLVVIDEEQRFGVTHKERLKQLRTQVDVLTMTATPIPRTLHLALMGARDLSLINTPPQGRMPIVTVVEYYDPALVRDAIRRELAREGQVYFVHNRVETIHGFANEIRSLVPEAHVAIGHGQMKPRELEDVMLKFLGREHDILVSTTIIENGLDIPNVNTILIDRADRFGLAQLYQLRGRVGRFTQRAYAYLLIPRHQRITAEAHERLDAIREFADLGAGLSLALRDLEIRGAGNLLGAEQSGEIAAIGFDLYCKMIAEAVDELRGGGEEPRVLPPAELGVPAHIPDEYVISPLQKLGLYKRLSLFRRLGDVEAFATELADRYGPLPPPLVHLLRLAEIRILGAAAGLEFVGRLGREIVFRFRPARPPAAETLQRLSGIYGRMLRLEPGEAVKLYLPITAEIEPKLVPLVRRVVGDLAPEGAATAAAAAR